MSYELDDILKMQGEIESFDSLSLSLSLSHLEMRCAAFSCYCGSMPSRFFFFQFLRCSHSKYHKRKDPNLATSQRGVRTVDIF